MTTVTVTVSFEPDSRGFTSRACPECGKRFKAAFGKGSSHPLAFCPFCHHEGARWETPEQIEYGGAYATREVVQPHFDKLDRSLRDLERAGGRHLRVRVSGHMPRLDVPAKPVEGEDDMPECTIFTCCTEVVRHASENEPAFCPICGEAHAQVQEASHG
jgi:hypothetical protein